MCLKSCKTDASAAGRQSCQLHERGVLGQLCNKMQVNCMVIGWYLGVKSVSVNSCVSCMNALHVLQQPCVSCGSHASS